MHVIVLVITYLSAQVLTVAPFSLSLSSLPRFKKAEDRKEYIEAMKTLLPLIYQRLMAILPDPSLPSVTLQHHILKIFYATMQVSYNDIHNALIMSYLLSVSYQDVDVY